MNKRDFSQYREFNRLGDDSCYISQKNSGNEKKLKYMTTRVEDSQFITEGKVNFMGLPQNMTASEFNPEIDTDLKFSNLTNCGDRTALGAFQLNAPNMGINGPNVLLTGSATRERGACTQVITEYQDLTFTPFINIEVPDPIRSVFTDGPQSGISTRSQNRIKQEKKPLSGEFSIRPVECERVLKFNRCK